MKNGPYVRTLALAAGVLGLAFTAGVPAANAGGLPSPHKVLRKLHHRAMTHVKHVDRFVDHSLGGHDRYRRDHYRSHRYGSQHYRGGYAPRYSRSAYGYSGYGYPVVVGGYRSYDSCHSCPSSGYVSGYVGAPRVGISVGIRPTRSVDRGEDCDRNDCGDGDVDQLRYEDDDDYDHDYDHDDDYDDYDD